MFTGRAPSGLRPSGADSPLDKGAHFAAMAALEAASVIAFRELARDLERHGAAPPLVKRCRRAARDEVRHARTARSLARRFGAAPEAPSVATVPPKSLLTIAIENAVEGGVKETFGALLAHYQARAAPDPSVRSAMQRIAREETEHAALSHRIDAWARSRLDSAGRNALDEARASAIVALSERVRSEDTLPFARDLGLPGAADREKLLQAFAALG